MSGFSRYVEVCHCGHSKSAHYEEKSTCLGVLCECREYVDRDDPDRPSRTKKPIVYPVINDYDPTWDICPTPITHPFWCVCPVCHPLGKP